jgi:DNA-binding transcriptional MocR family regulator
VAPATIAAAYSRLRARGLIETRSGRGTRVRQHPLEGPRSAHCLPVPPGAVDLSTGEPDPRLLPSLSRYHQALAGPPVMYGNSGLDRRFEELARRRLSGDGIPAEHLLATSGALDAIDRVLSAHLRPGDPVAVEDPCWGSALDLLAATGMRALAVSGDDQGPDPQALERAIASGARALIVTSRAQNPTGASVSASRGTTLRRLLVKSPQVLVIEDDHAAELSDRALSPLVGCTEHWAFVRSLSKPYGPDLRLAAVAADEVTASRVLRRQRLGQGWVSHILQRCAAGMWSDPGAAAVVATAARAYDRRRNALVSALGQRGVAARGASGLNVWVTVPDETTAAVGLTAAGWVPAPGSRFRLNSGPGLRLTVSALADDDIERLADAIAASVGDHSPRRSRSV